jgi:tetratricopeptide (TPR) repeat protein
MERALSTHTKDSSKPRSAYVEEAVQLAVDARWEDAIELNQQIVETFGADEATHNRIGKALTELGRLDKAKSAYESSLALNPLNPVARKNAQKLESLMKANLSLRGGAVKVDLNLFVEEMGKTTTTTLRATDDGVSSKVAPGDVADLRVEGDGIEVDTVRGVRIGSLEPKLARRLLKFIQGGNRYQAGVTSSEGLTVRLIVREVYQDPKFAGKPSFPITRKRDVEFRPYARDTLVAREAAAYAPSVEEDELDATGAGAAGFDEDEDETLHEVEDDESDDTGVDLDDDLGASEEDES